jgi:hypothetical protein
MCRRRAGREWRPLRAEKHRPGAAAKESSIAHRSRHVYSKLLTCDPRRPHAAEDCSRTKYKAGPPRAANAAYHVFKFRTVKYGDSSRPNQGQAPREGQTGCAAKVANKDELLRGPLCASSFPKDYFSHRGYRSFCRRPGSLYPTAAASATEVRDGLRTGAAPGAQTRECFN